MSTIGTVTELTQALSSLDYFLPHKENTFGLEYIEISNHMSSSFSMLRRYYLPVSMSSLRADWSVLFTFIFQIFREVSELGRFLKWLRTQLIIIS